MSRGRITDAVKSGRILVSDGAWGTFLQQQGLKPGECPEEWCLSNRQAVYNVAKSYIEAGADMIQTNSFGGSRYKLEHFDLADKVAQINESAANISREAAGNERWVIASVGPTGKMLMMDDVTELDLYEAFQVQTSALEKGGADAICIETMFALDEITQAIKAAKENTECEIIATFTFELTPKGEYRTMMGTTPAEFARTVINAGADIIGTNCGNGSERMVEIIKEIKQSAPVTPILVHSNAGLPKYIDGADVFPESPDEMASFVPSLVEAGANIIGGCCGSTPEHISRIKKVASSME
jgi:5-methyltetrahydrofolate--homocysteine methyltransferase